MELTKIAEQIKDLPNKEKMAILELIDIKVSSDMKEVIQEIKLTRESYERQMASLEKRMNSQTTIVTLAITILGLLITLYNFFS
ncbi:hypothetical protein [Maribacter sp.]|uniref:hypothetical protein n=1 Tax=Maribacter sp. TaxID=1897614 RepID=UPI0025C722E1|nr:hypothetical protein [Maribacter sp.]|tara:strand:+ start:3079 stop:3330 length:252 start_codon:yes stop_codon:yes gene_type:complete